MQETERSVEADDFIGHEPCPECGSKDNLGRWADGHAFCFGCEYRERPTGADRGGDAVGDGAVACGARGGDSALGGLELGEAQPLLKRGITQATCEKWGYTVGEYRGKKAQYATYFRGGVPYAAKVRMAGKNFLMVGKPEGLYGEWLWRSGGKMVVVTEGEIDALTVSQLQGNRWPVVSVTNGAAGAAKSIKRSIEWLESFERVVFMFDMDAAGRKAAVACAELLKPGRGYIATLPLKDANEMLQEGRGKEVIDAIWGAKAHRPDGILDGEAVWERLLIPRKHKASVDWPWRGIQQKTRGLRRGELVTLTSGTGIGKSSVCRELAYHLLQQGETVGYIALEESVERTALGLMGIHLNRPLHLEMEDYDDLTAKDKVAWTKAYKATVGNGRAYLYDDWGSVDVDNLLSRVRYLARGCDCGWVFLDHLSIVVSGLDVTDERRAIDQAMTMLRSLVEETDIGLILVSHLKRPSGDKGHEDGAETHLSQLRGSHAIGQLSDLVVGWERNQQGKSPNVLTARVLKNRFSGETGLAGALAYDRETGRLMETTHEFDSNEDRDVGDLDF